MLIYHIQALVPISRTNKLLMKLFSSGFNLIQPSLIQQLEKILNQYPDEGQILKVRQRLLKYFNLNSLAPA